jgi:hypothetical protein
MAPGVRGRPARVSVSEPDHPTPGPGDADTTEVQTPTEAPSPLETPAEEPKPAEEPAGTPDDAQATFSTPAAFSTPTPPPDPPAAEIPGAAPSSPVDKAAQVAQDRPEVAVGAAFAGGLVLALLLKRLGD